MQPDAEAFVGALRPAVRKAASIARALEGRVRNRPKSGEASDAKAALTLADSAAQEAILIPLHAGFPGLGLVAEEDTPSVGRFPARSDARVVVDPIDGTLRSYLDGSGPYAVMVGLSVAGQYEAALVGLPREDLYFDAVRGQGAHVATAAGRPHPVELDPAGRRVMISYDAPPAAAVYLLERDYQPVPGCGGAIAVAPCIPGFCGGLRFANRPQGISPQGRIGLLVAGEAGASSASDRATPFPALVAAEAHALLVARDDASLELLRGALEAAR